MNTNQVTHYMVNSYVGRTACGKLCLDYMDKHPAWSADAGQVTCKTCHKIIN